MTKSQASSSSKPLARARPLTAAMLSAGLPPAGLRTRGSGGWLDIAVGCARERAVWDVPIGAHQAVSHPLARAETAMAKYTAFDAASTALDAAMQTLGGNGMSREYGLATLHGLVRLFRIASVSSEMLLNHIAHKRLSLPRSY